jgi:Zn-dependent protease with chaperone function
MVTWVCAGGILVLLLAFNFGLGTRLLRMFRLLQPATDHLKALVTEISQRMNVRVNATWIINTYASNAMALPLTGELIFTDKLLATLTDEETKAICAHELSHLKESGRVKLMRLVVSMAFFPLIFCRPLGSLGDNGASIFTFLVIGALIIWLMGIRMSRRMEKRADKIAQDNTIDAGVFARALERLYEVNKTPAVMPYRSKRIHPDLYDRMITAGVTPDFPKPKAAKGQCWTSHLMLANLFLLPTIIFCTKVFMGLWDAFHVHVQ